VDVLGNVLAAGEPRLYRNIKRKRAYEQRIRLRVHAMRKGFSPWAERSTLGIEEASRK
jgi:hypothetical protein